MKKFCFVFLINLIFIFSNLSVSNAQHVRVADVGVSNFVKNMQGNIQDISLGGNWLMEYLNAALTQDAKKFITDLQSIVLLNPIRNTSIDKPGYYGYISKVINKENRKEKARFLFYSNAQGYLDNISIICWNPEYDGDFAAYCWVLSIISLGMDIDEGKITLYNCLNKVEEHKKKDASYFNETITTYCKTQKRYFDFHFYECNKNHFHLNISARN